MRGSLVIIAALCAIAAAAEASSVRFVSADEGQNGKDKAHRSEASEGTDQAVQKKVEDAVKKINDGEELLEKMVKSLDAERSSTGDKAAEGSGEGVKKAASSEKSKVQKRDVSRALERLAKRGMKMARAEKANVFDARKIIVKYLSLQKTVTNKITASLIFAVEQLETDETEKENLIKALKTFENDLGQVYDNTIGSLGPQTAEADLYRRKSLRADEISALMTSMNQRNPLALIPMLGRLITGAVSVADIANSFHGTRSDIPDMTNFMDMVQKLLSAGNLPLLPDYE